MSVPLHIGVGHPSALWLLATALLAFVAGLGVNLYRSRRGDHSTPATVDDPPGE